MFLRILVVALLLALPAQAQRTGAVAAPDCTADVDLTDKDGLKVAVVYRCRSTNALIFHAVGEKGARNVLSFTDGAGKALQPSGSDWWVEPVNGLVEAHYRFDLAGYAAAVDRPTLAVL